MSQVSQRLHCYCCQVGFSTTSHKCNGKTVSERVEKTVPEPFLTFGRLQIATSLKELLVCSKYWSYLCDITFKARYRRRQRPRANEEKSESTLLKSRHGSVIFRGSFQHCTYHRMRMKTNFHSVEFFTVLD